jgi:hypothetical protein
MTVGTFESSIAVAELARGVAKLLCRQMPTRDRFRTIHAIIFKRAEILSAIVN